jgi:hypothetical protein
MTVEHARHGGIKGALALLAGSAALDTSFLSRELAVEQSLDGAARNAAAAVDNEHRERDVTTVDRAVHGRATVAEKDGRLVDAQERLRRYVAITL